MVTFDASEPGTSRDDWSADPRLAALPTRDLEGFGAVVVLAAHPDDETLGAGGLMARAAREGRDVTVVCVTDGAGSSQGDARRDVVRTREAELRLALDHLGILRPPSMLGFADGSVREDRADIAARLVDALPGLAVETLLVAPWIGDGHRDHRVLGEIAADLAQAAGATLWQYPVWLWHWGRPDHPDVPWSSLVALEMDQDQRELVRLALEAFESQRSGAQPMLHERFLSHFDRDREYFVE